MTMRLGAGWRDELQPLIGQKLESPSSDIVVNVAEGSVTFKDSATLVDYVTMSIQINHDWELGTTVYPHIHWWQISSNIPNWLTQYRWQKQGAAKTTAWTYLPLTGHAFTYVTGTLNQITGFTPIIPPVGYGEVSDIVQIRLLRDTNNDSSQFAGADPQTGNVDITSFDVHLRGDSHGSVGQYKK